MLGAFAEAGVRDLVWSPGSRSTPFLLAAERSGAFTLHRALDERSGAFYALGLARATGRPPLLLCTSGSAGAHWYAAALEASLAHLPLLLLTADRPLELQDCAAPQTVDQTRLFGEHVRAFFELGAFDPQALAVRAMRRKVAQAVASTRWPSPGPVQLNAPARKPLEPGPTTDIETSRAIRTAASTPVTRFAAPVMAPSDEAVDEIAGAFVTARRPLIVCGPAPLSEFETGEALQAFARAAGIPAGTEATSQWRFGGAGSEGWHIDGLDLLLRSDRFLGEPVDLVLQFGLPPTSGGWTRWLQRHPGIRRVVITGSGWPDPESSATEVVIADPVTVLERLHAALPSRAPLEWTERLMTANRAAWRAEAVMREAAGFSEAETARRVAASVPAEGVLLVSNGLPVRLVDEHCPAHLAQCRVISQRGLNGIDGMVAGAAGVAATGRPTVALLGDVALLHDLGSLEMARRATAPLVLVVLNNDGGRIFEQLPVATTLGPAHLEFFTTPHGLRFADAARGFGIAYQRAESEDALGTALDEALGRRSCTLVEVLVPPSGAAELTRALGAAVDLAVRQAWGEP